MRIQILIVALMTVLATFGRGGSVQAQPQSQPAPNAPQPQKKAAPASKPAPTKDDNPFPEDVSRDAAKAASGDAGKPSLSKDNPFPEEVSRDAAKAAGDDSAATPAGKNELPPGVSSSRSSSSAGEVESGEVDPGRAKKDTEIGAFYLKSGDYQGALHRYKDATAADPGNVEAIFGLAETERRLKKNTEAAHNYQLYLDIVPNGPKAKQALKALKNLPPS